jgi:hypothetical protein
MVEVFPGKSRKAYIGAALDKKPTLQNYASLPGAFGIKTSPVWPSD